MDNAKALSELYHLIQRRPGLLQITTAVCASPLCQGEMHDLSILLTDNRHFVLHDAVRVEKLARGRIRVWSAEGDWTYGYPADVLRRLLEPSGMVPEHTVEEAPKSFWRRLFG